MILPDKVKKKLRDLPDKPGCYMMRNADGKIIYVGKAKSLRKRVRTYFRKATLKSADAKLRSLVGSVEDLDYIVVSNEAEAILTEGRLIKDYKPRYNVAFRDDKRFLLLRALPRRTFPRLELVRIKRDDGAFYFGPYASAQAARVALDFTEKRFGIRKCTPRLPDKETYRHCINDIVRFCSAPCIGKVTRDEYMERFDEACAFLRGERIQYLNEIREEMNQASEELEYERAAALRDILMHLERTLRQNARVAPTPEMQKAAAKSGLVELQELLKLEELPTVIEAYDVSNISGAHSVASMVCAVDGMPRRNRYRRFRIEGVEGIDDPRMIAEVVRRRFKRLTADKAGLPSLILVDGGITQLRAAMAALKELGITHMPCAGLAKQYEEIYHADSPAPIRLPRDSNALKVLQRLRDEAHRFAITYHRNLRNKRIRESALDGVVGIGTKRKLEILRHFGSVHRLIKASEEDIAAVPGIGPAMAHTIRRTLDGADVQFTAGRGGTSRR
ncbi:MAG: excinuclease ABC subunit UvrC [Kiritimatiellia bacterium]|jgi:excinuclease ABC subunit C|nr:excinuclease ABC subunit UvrC [Kiritimatiellia bacterium]MDP6848133.1 excinuclease ABC subunit UvrC [Kiritimatiellia bacterium]